MTFSSPSWRSLNLSKRSLNHPKKVTTWITRCPSFIPHFFDTYESGQPTSPQRTTSEIRVKQPPQPMVNKPLVNKAGNFWEGYVAKGGRLTTAMIFFVLAASHFAMTPCYFAVKPPTPYHPWDWYIHLHDWLVCMVNVGKYTIHVDAMGTRLGLNSPTISCIS